MKKSLGISCAVGSAAIYGVTPLITKVAYAGGCSTLSLSFFRFLLATPMIYLILRRQGISIKVDKRELKDLIFLAVSGTLGTSLMYYGSFHYISTGLATSIHYVYPILVAAMCVLVYKDKLSKTKLVALFFSFAGMLLFMEGDMSFNVIGFLLAFSSGVAYACFVVYLEKSSVRDFPAFKLIFYLAMISAVGLAPIVVLSGQLTYQLTPLGWLATVVLAVLISVVGNSLVPVAVRNIGAAATSILGMVEPFVSIVLGALFLGEVYTLLSLLGCGLILAAVTLLTLEKPTEAPLKNLEEPSV